MLRLGCSVSMQTSRSCVWKTRGNARAGLLFLDFAHSSLYFLKIHCNVKDRTLDERRLLSAGSGLQMWGWVYASELPIE